MFEDDAISRGEAAALDLARHFIPKEGEWYTAMQSFWTRDFGIAGMELKVISVDQRLDDLLRRAFIEAVVEDGSGMRYQLPHAGTQALYKREAEEDQQTAIERGEERS